MDDADRVNYDVTLKDAWLVCGTCHAREPVGDLVKRERDGYPVCCGETKTIRVDTALRPHYE